MNQVLRHLLFLPEQASTFAPATDRLHFFVIGMTMLASFAIGTTALLFYWRFRRVRDAATTLWIAAGWRAEALVVSGPLVFFLLWWFIGFRQFVLSRDPPPQAMDVYVTAKQWMWHFTYPAGSASVDSLHVPADRPVRLLLTSRDVIHSFFVPAFRVKQDALPGRYTEIWFEATTPGVYDVFCAEYCGLAHSRMRARVVVLPPAEFDRWLSERVQPGLVSQDAGALPGEPTRTDLAALGKDIALRQGCFQCHSVDGTPHIGPTFLGLFGSEQPLATGHSVLANEAYLTESMMDPRAKVVRGFQPVMPSYQGRLHGAETAALVEFIKSLGGGREALP